MTDEDSLRVSLASDTDSLHITSSDGESEDSIAPLATQESTQTSPNSFSPETVLM